MILLLGEFRLKDFRIPLLKGMGSSHFKKVDKLLLESSQGRKFFSFTL